MSVQKLALKQQALRGMVTRYKQHDYDVGRIVERAKRMKEVKLFETAALESVECASHRLKHFSSRSSGSSEKSFQDEMDELGEED